MRAGESLHHRLATRGGGPVFVLFRVDYTYCATGARVPRARPVLVLFESAPQVCRDARVERAVTTL